MRTLGNSAMRMMYARFCVAAGERLLIFEPGLDMTDPKDGQSRGESYVLEFASVLKGLEALLGRRA